jgi:hypothetical protein
MGNKTTIDTGREGKQKRRIRVLDFTSYTLYALGIRKKDAIHSHFHNFDKMCFRFASVILSL